MERLLKAANVSNFKFNDKQQKNAVENNKLQSLDWLDRYKLNVKPNQLSSSNLHVQYQAKSGKQKWQVRH